MKGPAVPAENGARELHRFRGGLSLRHHKQISCSHPVERPALPDMLVVPLQQHLGQPAQPCVKPGDRVLKGQALGDIDCTGGVNVHAPTSGRVTAVEHRPMSHPSGRSGLCVVIDPDGEDRWCDLTPISDWENRAPEELVAAICAAGVVGLGGAVFPTHRKASLGRRRGTTTLVLNGAECEPYISCDEMLMREESERVIAGARVLQKVSGAERTIIAIEDQMGAVFEALAKGISDKHDIELVKVPAIYPEGGERQLIQVLTGREVPFGGLPADLGILVQNVGTAAAVADAIINGRPLIERYVTVTGHGVAKPGNLLALIGTPVAHLIHHCGGYQGDADRLVVGGPMMGFTLRSDSEPVVKASNCLLVLSAHDLRAPQPEMPCIRCGECARVCPAGLLPQQLQWQVRTGQWEAAAEHHLRACIECGCCDYVCPSHIPLAAWFKHGKGQLKTQAREREAADHARQRFDAREARLERQKLEKRERLAAKKKALRERSAAKKAKDETMGDQEARQ